MPSRGILIVMSAPSGAGKQTLLNRLGERGVTLTSTISATTRAPRQGETDGIDYYFLTRSEFERRIEAGDFVEWAEVHGNFYGTLHEELERCLRADGDVILELDVQGMRSLRAIQKDLASVFLMPPSMEELERRLRSRDTDNPEDIKLRLKNAAEEMAARAEFDYIVVNDDIDRAAGDMEAILRAERCRAWRQLQPAE